MGPSPPGTSLNECDVYKSEALPVHRAAWNVGVIGETEAQLLLMPLAKVLQLGSGMPEFSACSWSGSPVLCEVSAACLLNNYTSD